MIVARLLQRIQRPAHLLAHSLALLLAFVACTAGSVALAQTPYPRPTLVEPVYRIAREPDAPSQPQAQTPAAEPAQAEAQPQEHPLVPAIRLATNGLHQIDTKMKDYSCTLIKRENINGTVGPHEYIFTKVRHQPFSVYMYFLGPEEMKGRECIYVAGQNENKMIAHEGRGLRARFGAVRLDPNGWIAMQNQRYPITDVGIRNLTSRLIEVAEMDTKFGECEVQFYKGAKINGRVCTCLEVVHPVPRTNFRFYKAQIFIDDELQIPIRYASYDWPRQQGEAPLLLEEYTYLNMKVNNGFTDADFDERNPNYRFR